MSSTGSGVGCSYSLTFHSFNLVYVQLYYSTTILAELFRQMAEYFKLSTHKRQSKTVGKISPFTLVTRTSLKEIILFI